MAVSDFVADCLTKIRNASNAGKENVDIKSSVLIGSVLKIMKQERYILDYREVETAPAKSSKKTAAKKSYRIYLRMTRKGEPVIQGIARISKPGLRVYADIDRLTKDRRKLGISVVSTSKGIMTDEEAIKNKMGGEVICRIW
jgi:small subunit ribosomal protein S8